MKRLLLWLIRLWLIFIIFASNVLFWITIKNWRRRDDTRDNLYDIPSMDLHSKYMMKYQPYHFVIQDHFTLPMPKATLPIYNLIRQQWMENIRNYLLKIPPNTNSSRSLISIIACDSKFEDVLLNWLISATLDTNPPLTNVLILALDRPLQSTLAEHGFDSVYVDSKDLLSDRIISKLASNSHSAFYVVMILRLTVMRLLNHWGYDAANYDADAIILKNPELLYYGELSDSNLIGSRGRFPEEAKNAFGLTICAGMFMIKSSPETEEFWSTVSDVLRNSVNDQEKLNTALMRMKLQSNNVTFTEEKNWVGRNSRGFVVTSLHLMLVCRRWCVKTKKQSYYVWHHGGKFSEGKIERARSEAMWFLREDWSQVAEKSTATGVQWLMDMKK